MRAQGRPPKVGRVRTPGRKGSVIEWVPTRRLETFGNLWRDGRRDRWTPTSGTRPGREIPRILGSDPTPTEVLGTRRPTPHSRNRVDTGPPSKRRRHETHDPDLRHRDDPKSLSVTPICLLVRDTGSLIDGWTLPRPTLNRLRTRPGRTVRTDSPVARGIRPGQSTSLI